MMKFKLVEEKDYADADGKLYHLFHGQDTDLSDIKTPRLPAPTHSEVKIEDIIDHLEKGWAELSMIKTIGNKIYYIINDNAYQAAYRFLKKQYPQLAKYQTPQTWIVVNDKIKYPEWAAK